jgi:hypothetical protein
LRHTLTTAIKQIASSDEKAKMTAAVAKMKAAAIAIPDLPPHRKLKQG